MASTSTRATRANLISSALAFEIYEQYRQSQCRNDTEYKQFVRQAAEEHKLPEREVRAVLAHHEIAYANSIAQRMLTDAERTADMVGATLPVVVLKLLDKLEAQKRRPLTDSKGRMVRDCEKCEGSGRVEVTAPSAKAAGRKTRKCEACKGTGGEIQWIETEDHQAQLAAAEKLIKIHGAYKPERIEVDGEIRFEEVPTGKLIDRIAELQPILRKLVRGQPGVTGNGANTRRIAGPPVVDGQVLLADQDDENRG